MNFLNGCFTGKDNATTDLGRVLWFICFVALFGMQIYSVIHGEHFDIVSAAAAYGGLLAGGAAALRIKSSTEPGS